MLIGCLLVATGDSEDLRRKHRDGVLTVDDFRAKIPNGFEDLDAIVHTQLSFRYTFRTVPVEDGVKVVCTQVACNAEQVPGKSWIRLADESNSDVEALLDHEQGHFDLSQLMAKKAQLRLKYLTRKKKLVGRGADETAAEAELARKIQAQLSPFERQLMSVNSEYDKETEHGQIKAAQKKARRKQKEQLRMNRSASR